MDFVAKKKTPIGVIKEGALARTYFKVFIPLLMVDGTEKC